MNEWYYLHTNGQLLYKRFEPESDSPFVRRVWPVDPTDRSTAWRILLEAIGMVTDTRQIRELAAKWGCDAKDLVEYMVRVEHPSMAEKDGLPIFIDKIIGADPDEWMNWLAATPKGAEPNWDTMPLRKKQ